MAQIPIAFPGQTISVFAATDITGTSGTVASDSYYFPKPGPWVFSIWDYYTATGGSAAMDIDLDYQVCFEDTAAKYVTSPPLTGYSGNGNLRTGYTTKATWDCYHNYPVSATFMRFLITKNAGNTATAVAATITVYFTKTWPVRGYM